MERVMSIWGDGWGLALVIVLICVVVIGDLLGKLMLMAEDVDNGSQDFWPLRWESRFFLHGIAHQFLFFNYLSSANIQPVFSYP